MIRLQRLMLPIVALLMLQACTIEPPLKLATSSEGVMMLGKVITNVETIWDTDDTWRQRWWYGWDETDRRNWGELEYPMPQSYETRFYFHGARLEDNWKRLDRRTIYESEFHRRFDYGHHRMLIWTNVDNSEGTQTLLINEDDPDNIYATTTPTRLGYAGMPRAYNAFNQPDIFYASDVHKIFMSRNKEDYDYFDRGRNAWVKEIKADLYPLVYIYLVQVVVYNNRSRITGTVENPSINSLADGVSIHTGHTSNTPVRVVYESRMKQNLPARDGRMADIIGGKLTTFGLCDMEAWSKSRGSLYAGSRADLKNHLSVNLTFSNSTNSVYHWDVTKQMLNQAHGGIITIEIDADTLHIPKPNPGGGGSGSGFDPTIADPDEEDIEFDL